MLAAWNSGLFHKTFHRKFADFVSRELHGMFLRWFRKRRDLRYLLWPQKQQRCQDTPQLSEFEFARVSSLELSSFRLQRCVASAGSVTVACVVLPALNKTLQPAGPPPSSENTY
jgi:hypothetical protein